MPYIYDDGDNTPMNEEAWQHERSQGEPEKPQYEYKLNYEGKTIVTLESDHPINPGEAMIECMMAACTYKEELPFTDPPDGCWNCQSFDWTREACTVNWNNMDESYYNPDIDDRKPDDHCECWELNPDAKWEDWHD